MTERQKSQSELDQELSDAMLARQLQDEMIQENEAAAQQRAVTNAAAPPAPVGNATAPAPTAPTAGEVKVDCPACTFTNVLHHIEDNKTYKCQQCLTPLPVVAPHRASRQQKGSGETLNQVVCEACQSINKIPHQKADAMLCGTCYQKLNVTDTSGRQPGQQHQLPHATDVEQGERSVQVVCGKCNTVNAVHVNANVKQVHFMCGKCNTVNEITL